MGESHLRGAVWIRPRVAARIGGATATHRILKARWPRRTLRAATRRSCLCSLWRLRMSWAKELEVWRMGVSVVIMPPIIAPARAVVKAIWVV